MITKTKTTKPLRWHDIEIPSCLESIGKPTTKLLRLRLADFHNRKAWELSLTAIRTERQLSVYLFIVDRRNPTETLPLPKTTAIAQELIGKREQYAVNSGFDFCFRHESGFVLLQSLLNELAEQLAAQRQPQRTQEAIDES